MTESHAVSTGAGAGTVAACEPCLRRAWLVARLAGRIDLARRGAGRRLSLVLGLDDDELMRALDAPAAIALDYERFPAGAARDACRAAALSAVCRHDARFPSTLLDLPDPPAVIYATGSLDRLAALTGAGRPAVAVVGARRASGYGLEVARALGRGLAAADVTVVSGMALGVDSAAHAGALEARGPTVAVLAGGADRPYPPSKRRLYEQIRQRGCIVSELPPGTEARRWCFPARNRLIAALGGLTVIVEAAERSGSLITAELARELGRDVGAVPGRVTASLAAGTNALLRDGAAVIAAPEDALDLACGVGGWRRRGALERVPERLRGLLAAVSDGSDSVEALASGGHEVGAAMSGLTELELMGHVRRTIGGRYVVCA